MKENWLGPEVPVHIGLPLARAGLLLHERCNRAEVVMQEWAL